MALNLPMSDGADRTPIIKYDARAGRLFRVDRTQADGSWESNTVEITPVFQAVFDMENIEIGWLYFPTNGAPDIRVVKQGEALPEKPSPQHRPGFRVHMLLGKQAGGDVREMAANANVSIKGMNVLHNAYEEGVKKHPGQLPVVQLGGTTPIQSGGKGADGKAVSSTNYQPDWVIRDWVARPAALAANSHAGAAEQDATKTSPMQQDLPVEPVQPASVADDF